MYEDKQAVPERRWFWSITVYVDPKFGLEKATFCDAHHRHSPRGV
jgi:hypothetical protein